MTEERKILYKMFAYKLFVGGLLVGAGFLLHALIYQNTEIEKTFLSTRMSQNNGELRFKENNTTTLINPLLECGELENISNKEVEEMKKNILYIVDKNIAAKQVSHISVYFRDLNNGPWFGINEKENFIPGSLLKVPLLLALYKEAEKNPSFLENTILFEKGVTVAEPYFKPPRVITQGSTYTVQELIEYMIKYSDNNATLLLSQLLNPNDIDATYRDIAVTIPKDKNYTTSVRTYASFFRILFNATYLSKQYSEKALKLLSETTFTDALRDPIPHTIPVAHKFGERTILEGQENQLHDCGIVYVPNRPYLLCVMTRGNSYENMAKTIQTISKTVYEKIN